MAKKKRRWLAPPKPWGGDEGDWEAVVEEIEGFENRLVLGRWRIYLIKGAIRYGHNDGWGWTKRGSREKAVAFAEKQLKKRRERDQREKRFEAERIVIH